MNVISVSFKSAPLAVRALFAFSKEEQSDFFKKLFNSIPAIAQCVIISTCNRCEFYFDSDRENIKKAEHFICNYKGMDIEKAIKYFNVFTGENAIGHLLKVACGIDSMVLGEDEILRQVKESYYFAMENNAVSTEFNTIFKMAITAAKEIKTVTGLSSTPVSIGTLTANEVFRFKKEEKHILIIGITGKIGSITAKNIADKDNTEIIGTSGRHSANTVLPFSENIVITDFSNRYKFMDWADVVISATSSPHYTVTKDELKENIKTKKPRLFIDLAVPNDIDSAIKEMENCRLFDIDYFNTLSKTNNRIKKTKALSAAEYVKSWTDEIIKELCFRDIINGLPDLEKIVEKRSLKHLIYSLRKLSDRNQTESVSEWLNDYIKEWSR